MTTTKEVLQKWFSYCELAIKEAEAVTNLKKYQKEIAKPITRKVLVQQIAKDLGIKLEVIK